MQTATGSGRPELQPLERNHFFYGKHLTEDSLTAETRYMNGKRWLVNRRILGYGIVCGLKVIAGPQANQIVVEGGLAIDGWGREIVVPAPTAALTIPPEVMTRAVDECGEDEDVYVHVVLCYHECLADPEPTFVGDCNVAEPCVPGTIREEYRIEFRSGRAPDVATDCRIPDLVSRGRLDYEALARWVSRRCVELPKDSCICLANLEIEEHDGHYECRRDEIELGCRPIVYTNRLLFDILLCLAAESSPTSAQSD